MLKGEKQREKYLKHITKSRPRHQNIAEPMQSKPCKVAKVTSQGGGDISKGARMFEKSRRLSDFS